MTIKMISEKVKELKKIIITIVQEVVEPSSWVEFMASQDVNEIGIYRILDDDLPVMRDLKAFFNMLSAVESMSDKITTKYALFGASVATKITIVQDISYFYQYYKVYRSTNSIVTHYLGYLKEVSLTVILPELITKMRELSNLCTTENLDKVSDFMIEQVISLEQYQDNYLQKKQLKAAPKEVVSDKKSEQNDDFITTVVKKNDQYLKQIYKEKYDTHFHGDIKTDEKKAQILDYYPENKKDTDIIKNIKLLLNGIIGVKKVLDDHEAYQQSNIYTSVSYMSSFIMNLRKTYSSLSDFDYQAIISEKSTPFTDEIKQQLIKLNEMLGKVACIADQFELELRLKEGTLLKKVDLLIDRHNQMMSELRIPTDYIIQKNIFYKVRLQSRQNKVSEMDVQINQLRQFMDYKTHALMDIPYFVNNSMQDYIKKYSDDICMDRDRLKKYQEYLVSALNVKRGFRSYVASQVEGVANYYGATKHAEFTSALYNRLMYLQKQKLFIIAKNQKLLKYHQENPYDNFKLTDINDLGQAAVVLKLLKARTEELGAENEKLFVNAVVKKDVKTELKEINAEPKDLKVAPKEVIADPKDIKVVPREMKTESSDVKASLTDKNIDKDKTKVRVVNQIQLKCKELAFFRATFKSYEEKHIIPATDLINKEVYLSPKSVILLHELSELSKLPERKLGGPV